MGKRTSPVSYKCSLPCNDNVCPGHSLVFDISPGLVIVEVDGIPKSYMDDDKFQEFKNALRSK